MTKRLILLFLLALLLRLLPVFSNSVSFHYDMARDATVAQDILHGDLKVVGPPSSSPNLFHGVWYYYFIAVGYFFSDGNPQGVAALFSSVHALGVVPIYLLATGLFRSRKLGVVAGLLYACSFEASQYGPWISNPSLALPLLGFYFLGLWYWSRGSDKGMLLSVVTAVVATQLQLFLSVLFFNLILFWVIFRPFISRRVLVFSGGFTFLGLSSYVLSYSKTNSSSALVGIINSPNQFVFRTQFTDVFVNFLNRFADIYINNFVPTNIFLGGLLAIVCFWSMRQHRFVLFTLLTNLPLFFFGGHNSSYINVGLVFPAILSVLVAFRRYPVFIFIIIAANLISYITNFSRGQLALVIPKDMILSSQLKLMDQTYHLAAGQPFSLNTLTLPLWTNTTWAYLYHWYGQATYGYVPQFYGRNQINLPGDAYLPHNPTPLATTFYIVEPPDGIGPTIINSELVEENGRTQLKEEYHYGQLVLQHRTPWLQ